MTWVMKHIAAAMTAVILLGVVDIWVAAAGQCEDPLPVNPEVITKEMGLKAFSGADQFGPGCGLNWEARNGQSPALLIYGPKSMAKLGQKFSSTTKEAADQYGGESPKGVEPVPGLANAYMVFDPKTPNRRIFIEYKKKVYMIVSGEKIPLATIVKSVLQQ
jgi:hypothetical protein